MKIGLYGVHVLTKTVDTLAKIVETSIKTLHRVKNSCPDVRVIETTYVL